MQNILKIVKRGPVKCGLFWSLFSGKKTKNGLKKTLESLDFSKLISFLRVKRDILRKFFIWIFEKIFFRILHGISRLVVESFLTILHYFHVIAIRKN